MWGQTEESGDDAPGAPGTGELDRDAVPRWSVEPQELPGDSIMWHALDREGLPAAELLLAPGQKVMASLGSLLVVTGLGPFDRPHVVRYRIRR